MRIILDAFGGDNAPLEALRGASMAAAKFGVTVVLCGHTESIQKCSEENGISLEGLEIMEAPHVFLMEDDPALVLKKDGTSLAAGLHALSRGEGDAFVSAGSTGALVIGATFIVKRIRGIKRMALGTVLPGEKKPYLMLDIGANSECRPEMLCQFASMGSVYMKNVMGIDNPSVGLLNIGAEETKGTGLQIDTYKLLKENNAINFTGNIEAREGPMGVCDVLVTDGYSGNIYLKLSEGLASVFVGNIKTMMMKNAFTKICSLIALKKGMKAFAKKMDYTEYGGAPLIGAAKPVIKAHGSSDAKAFCSAVGQAVKIASGGVCEKIAAGERKED